jgi:DNA-binding response OmpR family regulator
MPVAHHPPDASQTLLAALAAAGVEARPVADPAGVLEAEPDEGWAAVVVELGAEPAVGLAFARRVQDAGTAPVLVIAGRGDVADLVGASFDDFVLAPLDPAELALRISRLAGGEVTAPDEVLEFKDLALNTATYQASVGETPIDLTFMEYELLRFFVSNPGRVWSREQLLSRVWGYDYFGGARTVDVHVRRLRAKLGEERAPWITTVRSVGYRFG